MSLPTIENDGLTSDEYPMGLDVFEIVMAFEDHFGVAIPEENWCELKTVGDLHKFILKALEARSVEAGSGGRQDARTTDEHRHVWSELCRIVSRQLSIPIADIHPKSRWIEDLGCD